jgi:hypothetical protein
MMRLGMRECGVLLAISLLSACDKKEAPPADVTASPTAEAVAPPPPLAAAKAAVAVDLNTLPVEEDFESEAETELTQANLSTELDQLEKEIDSP